MIFIVCRRRAAPDIGEIGDLFFLLLVLSPEDFLWPEGDLDLTIFRSLDEIIFVLVGDKLFFIGELEDSFLFLRLGLRLRLGEGEGFSPF